MFKLGTIFLTSMVNNKAGNDSEFADFIKSSLYRHSIGDWGDLCDEDIEINNIALFYGDRILSAYKHNDDETKIWIITESDRSCTTVLFPEEY